MSPLLPPGAKIAVVAPSHRFNQEKLDAGLELARAAGLELVCLPHLQRPHRYLAAPDAWRLGQLIEALVDPAWDAVWVVRGGSGITRLLRHLPWDRIPPRPLIGFSDLTPLLEAMRARTGAVGVHGPVLHSLAGTDPGDRQALFDLLAGRPTPALAGEAWRAGEATGPLVGGNLTLIAATCGTPWQVRSAGAILCLEDIGEQPYRVDRMLQQLLDAGVLDGVAGVALGTWEGCRAPDGADWSLDDVLRDVLLPLGVPVLAGLPFGHGDRNHPLPIGAVGRISGGALAWDLAGR